MIRINSSYELFFLLGNRYSFYWYLFFYVIDKCNYKKIIVLYNVICLILRYVSFYYVEVKKIIFIVWFFFFFGISRMCWMLGIVYEYLYIVYEYLYINMNVVLIISVINY